MALISKPIFSKSELDLLSKALLICWQIWEARNNMLFQDLKPIFAGCIHAAASVGLDYWKLNLLPRKDKDFSMMIKWHPPHTGWIEVNFDGSHMNSQASTGFVILDCNGHVLLASANNLGENSINVSESVALRDGLVAAIDRGWDQIIIEGDSKLVIDSILKKVTPPWSIYQIIQDIRSLSSSVSHVCFQHVFREANFTADEVAKLGHKLSSLIVWGLGLPLLVCSAFYFDLFGYSCPRGFVL
ncbi:unnamed protein product [Prunus armeniaca]